MGTTTSSQAMASTAHSDPEMAKERYDSPEELDRKVDTLVGWIQSAKHMVAFTGAGISTSAGIPDFRGPEGKWTREAQGLKPKSGVSTTKAVPTPTHMALVTLQRAGTLKYLVSQNCDGLHRRSGIPSSHISELHGNSNIEECEDCGQSYFRDFGCHRTGRSRDHYTGRRCARPGCGGRLLEYTIDFGQNLPQKPLNLAYSHAKKADLQIALGSSLTVSPANEIPRITAKKGRLVIVNLQHTPLTNDAAMQIYAKTDVVIGMVMERLGQAILPFRLERKIAVSAHAHEDGVSVSCRAVDYEDPTLQLELTRHCAWGKARASNGQNITQLEACGPQWHEGDAVEVLCDEGKYERAKVLSREKQGWRVMWEDGCGEALIPHEEWIRSHCSCQETDIPKEALHGYFGSAPVVVPVSLAFFGHYNEPNLEVVSPDLAPVIRGDVSHVDVIHNIHWDPFKGEWHHIRTDEHDGDDARHVRKGDNAYGVSHREYVVDGVQEHNKCSRKRAEEAVDRWFAESKK